MARGGMRLPRRKSKKIFTRGAQRVHPKNATRVMRGGIRL